MVTQKGALSVTTLQDLTIITPSLLLRSLCTSNPTSPELPGPSLLPCGKSLLENKVGPEESGVRDEKKKNDETQFSTQVEQRACRAAG